MPLQHYNPKARENKANVPANAAPKKDRAPEVSGVVLLASLVVVEGGPAAESPFVELPDSPAVVVEVST